jgi:hypothetical protein
VIKKPRKREGLSPLPGCGKYNHNGLYCQENKQTSTEEVKSAAIERRIRGRSVIKKIYWDLKRESSGLIYFAIPAFL